MLTQTPRAVSPLGVRKTRVLSLLMALTVIFCILTSDNLGFPRAFLFSGMQRSCVWIYY